MPEPPGDLEYILNITREALAEIQDEITGSIISSANAIVDVWEIDCEGQWILYVKTATIAAGAALYLLLTPSCEEVLENYLSPKPGRRHGRRGQRGDRNRRPITTGPVRLFFNPPIPDIDNAIADAIPGRDIIGGRRIGPGEHIFWTGIDLADRFLWYWLLIEATETFATRWMSEIVESGKCKVPNDATVQVSIVPRPFAGSDVLWQGPHQFESYYNENMQAVSGGDAVLDLASFEGNSMIICEIFVTLESTSEDKPGTFHFGPKITVRDSKGNIVDEVIEQTSLTVGPNSTASGSIMTAIFADQFQRANFQLEHSTEPGSGGFTRSVTSRTAVAVRSVQFVP